MGDVHFPFPVARDPHLTEKSPLAVPRSRKPLIGRVKSDLTSWEAAFAASLTPDLWPVGAEPRGCSFHSAQKGHVLRADSLVTNFVWPDLLFLFGLLLLAISLLSISPPSHLGRNVDSLF